jgi:transmembrane sensor
MAPSGGLAQDALAREVEAWARAGAADRARSAATEYARLYPTGRRLAAVRDLGGI